MNAPAESLHPRFQPGRVWTLRDMITYQVFGLNHLLVGLSTTEENLRQRVHLVERGVAEWVAKSRGWELTVTDRDREHIGGWLQYARQVATQLELETARHRLDVFTNKLARPISLTDLLAEVRVLREAFDHDLNFRYFYYYPLKKADLLLRIEHDWAAALAKFPSIKPSVEAALDCYAMGHHNAAMFSCMVVLERGLRALAADVGLKFDTQQWKNILDLIEGEIEKIRENGIPGMAKEAKDARLQFLSQSAKEFFYFKDAWRNHVAHAKADYDENQALGVISHTRALMLHLASRLSEAG